MHQDSEEEREMDEETEQNQFQNHHDETNHDNANQPEEDKYRQPSFMGMLFRCAMSALVGITVGFIIEKSRVFEPVTVRNQTVMKNLSIMKFVMSAVASGMFGLSVLAMVPPSHFKFQKVCLYFYSNLSDKGIIASVLGGWMLGAGMTISGGDPVIVLVQLGAGVKTSYYTVAGLFFGTLIFGILRPLYETITRPVLRSSTNPWAESSYFITALPLVAMFGMLSFAFEIIIPWTDDTRTKTTGKNVLTYKAWPPHLCGAVVGLLQIPMVLGAEQLLGGSSVYATLVSQIFVGPLRKVSPFLRRFRTGYQNWWQIFYIVGLIFGAHQSASFSHTLASAKGVHEYHALVGGFLMAFGVLLAGGATFVHGITGMGLLSILSFITIGAAFSAAILMGFIMSYAGIIIT